MFTNNSFETLETRDKRQDCFHYFEEIVLLLKKERKRLENERKPGVH